MPTLSWIRSLILVPALLAGCQHQHNNCCNSAPPCQSCCTQSCSSCGSATCHTCGQPMPCHSCAQPAPCHSCNQPAPCQSCPQASASPSCFNQGPCGQSCNSCQ